MQPTVSVFWFRRDLRIDDNAGLYRALKGDFPVLPLFIFDRNILDTLQDRNDARVEFIHQAVAVLKTEFEALGSTLVVLHGTAETAWQSILETYKVGAVYTNRDYEPQALARDQRISDLLAAKGIPFHTEKDHVIFEKGEVLKDDGLPYTVFTPYSRKWLARLNSRGEGGASFYLKSWPSRSNAGNLFHSAPGALPTLAALGFQPSGLAFPPMTVPQRRIKDYSETRDYPAIDGTSRLGVHFRFGTISIREKARNAVGLNATYLNELIWRDFYSQILAHFPRVATHPFKPAYDRIPWRDAPDEFDCWCKGKTGYPIVDAGMRELNTTGYMHNRVRMIAASFLTKHLLIDWRLGEAYFAEKLLDFDLASNNGGWQWAAGCGTDAAPYFRIFNPTEQAKKFDPEFKYIRKWVPEFGSSAYPKPMVDHVFARQRCLDTYKVALQ